MLIYINKRNLERSIAYGYEKQMLKYGKILSGVEYRDSLFRGIICRGDITGRR